MKQPPETLSAEELNTVADCVAIEIGNRLGNKQHLRELLDKLERMTLSARAAASFEESTSQLQ